MPLPLTQPQKNSFIAACTDPPGAARLLKNVVSKESLRKIAVASGDNDKKEGLGEESDTDDKSDNEANHRQRLQEPPPDFLPTGKRRACSLKSTKNGSNQRNICLTLRFLLKRIPALMNVPVTPVGVFRRYEWVGSFSTCNEASCMRNLVQDLRTTEPELRDVTIAELHDFYYRFVKMGKILLSHDENYGKDPGLDGVGQQQEQGGYRSTFVSEAMMQLARLDREYRMRTLEKNSNHHRQRGTSLTSVASADDFTSRVDRESQGEQRVSGKRRKIDSRQGIPRPYRTSPSAMPPRAEIPSTALSPLSIQPSRRHGRQFQQEFEPDPECGLDTSDDLTLGSIADQAAVDVSQEKYNKVWTNIIQDFPNVNTQEGASHTQRFLANPQRSHHSDQHRQQQQQLSALQPPHFHQLQQFSQISTPEITPTATSAIIEISDNSVIETITSDADENIDLGQTLPSASSSSYTEPYTLLSDDEDHRNDHKDTGAEDYILRTAHQLSVAGTVGKLDDTMRSSNQQASGHIVEVTQALEKHQLIMPDTHVIRHTFIQQPQSSDYSTSRTTPTATVFGGRSVDVATRTEVHTHSLVIGAPDVESTKTSYLHLPAAVSTTTAELEQKEAKALGLHHHQQPSPSEAPSWATSSLSLPLPFVGDSATSPRPWSSLTELVHTAITRAYEVTSLQGKHQSPTTTAPSTSAKTSAPILIQKTVVRETIDLARSYIQRQLYLRQQQQGIQLQLQTGTASASGSGRSDSAVLEEWKMSMITEVCETLLAKISQQQQQEQQLLRPPLSITTESSTKPSADAHGGRALTSQSSQPRPSQPESQQPRQPTQSRTRAGKSLGAAHACLRSDPTQKNLRYNLRSPAR
ncbi:MAG: hypothetical protein J3R72DRAFT_69261 [Linnemannia gamsii]|nr:MAG: hypothetical protein J3R72DRAFT_69261 [Linnemannia gamsii]